MPFILKPPSSRESLTESLRDLGRARRLASVAGAVLRSIAVVLGAVVLVCIADAGLHLSPLLRAVLLVGILGLAGIGWLRWVRPALRLRTDSLAVALELEARFPRLNDALGSAVSFLSQEEQSHDSPRMRRAVVTRARRLSERYNFRELMTTGQVWKRFWIAAVVVLAAITFALGFPQKATIAGLRLADPFGIHPWPPRTHVAIVQYPAQTAVGDTVEVRFELRGEIPPEAVVHVRLQSGSGFSKTIALPADEAAPEYRAVTATIDGSQVTESFSFAVAANDGDSGWHAVTAAPPPKLVPRDGRASPQVRAEFPSYTRLAAIDLSDGVGVIDAPCGTTFTLRAATDLRLESARLTFLGDRSAVERAAPASFVGLTNPIGAIGSRILADTVDRDFAISIGADHRTLDVVFRPSMSGLYGLRMTDETGITGTRLLEIRLQADPAPQVVLQSPAPGRDPDLLAPDVAVLFEAAAEDRIFAVRRTFLEYRFHKEEPYRELLLHDGIAAEFAAPALGGGGLTTNEPRPLRVDDRRSIPLSEFVHRDGSPPRAGETLWIRAAADDWDDVRAVKSPGRSAEIELHIAARDGIDAALQKELAEMRKGIVQARNQQREASSLARSIEPNADGSLRPEHREKLQNAEQIQKQIEGKVADARDGLRVKADRLRGIARINDLPHGATRDRVEAVAEGLGRLADRELPTIEPLLNEARQSASGAAERLAQSLRRQQSAEETFDAILEHLEKWGSAGEIAGEARGLRDAIEQQANRTGDLRGRIPDGAAPGNLTPAQRQELEKTAGKLDQLAEQAGGLVARAGRFAEERSGKAAEAAARAQSGTADAEAAKQTAAQASDEAEALRAAVQAAGGQALPEDLRRAAAAMRGNQTGAAAEAQRRAAERLGALGEALAEPPARAEVGALSGRPAADRMDELAEAQDQLRKKVRAAAAIPDPAVRAEALKRLAAEQERLREQAKEALQKLTRRSGGDAARDLQAALDQMEAAREDLERGNVPAEPQGDAIDRLEQARDRLDRAARPDARELSNESRRKLTEQVRALRDRQDAAFKEAERISAEALRVKGWPRPLQASLDDLADRERTLAEDVRGLSDKRFEKLPIIRRLLKESSDAMDLAGTRIRERVEDIVADPNQEFDAAVESAAAERFRQPMRLALRRLDQLIEALKPEEPAEGPKPPEPMPMEPIPPMGDPGDDANLIPPLAQLKVLRALQSELNERTAAFANDHPDSSKLTADERDELKALEQAQHEIAALFEEIVSQVPTAPEAP